MTRSTCSTLSYSATCIAAACLADTYAIFMGGKGAKEAKFANVTAYSNSLSKSTCTSASAARGWTDAVSIGNYVIFAGGYNDGYLSNCDAYNKSLTKVTCSALSRPKYVMTCASTGDYAFLAGGSSDDGILTEVERYDKNLTKCTPLSLTIPRYSACGFTYESNVYFMYGDGSSDNAARIRATAEWFDENLTSHIQKVPGVWLCSHTKMGNYVFVDNGNSPKIFSFE